MSNLSFSKKTKLSYIYPSLFLFSTYLLSLLLFFTYRLYFIQSFADRLLDETLWEIADCFLTGLRFDTLITAYFLFPLVLVFPWLRLQNKYVKILTLIYLPAIFSFTTIALLADVGFYRFFDTHLNYLAYEYIGEGALFADLVVSSPNYFERLVAWVIISIILFFAIKFLYNYFKNREPVNAPYKITPRLFIWLALIVLSFIGARGRLGLAPLDWGAAFKSQNHFVNQIPLNGLYTLSRSYLEDDHDPRLVYLDENDRFPFIDSDSALNYVRETLINDNENYLDDTSLFRTVNSSDLYGHDFKVNVVIVLMESWPARNTGLLERRDQPLNLTPNFDRLASEGILFTNFYANGTRTNYGLGATLCSFPSLPGRAILKRYNANHPFRTLSEILSERGYFNLFAYGGDLLFDNVEGFFKQKKYDRFLSVDDFGSENEFSKWGIPDQILFEKVALQFDSLPRPFNLTMLTLSNHEPFDLPDSSMRRFMDNSDSSKIYNAQIYADFALGEFIELIKQHPVSDSTIFVLTADHCKLLPHQRFLIPDNFHIPLLIYSPNKNLINDKRDEVTNQSNAVTGSQVDLLPTIMGLLGGEYTHSNWGRDLLNLPGRKEDIENNNTINNRRGFAIFNSANRIGYVDDEFFYAERLGIVTEFYELESLRNRIYEDVTDKYPDRFNWIQSKIHNYMQTADQLSTPRTQ